MFHLNRIGILLFYTLTLLTIIIAQNELDTIEIPEDFFAYHDASWSSDSTRFSFFSTTGISRGDDENLRGVNITQDAWWGYDLASGQLSNQNRWTLQRN